MGEGLGQGHDGETTASILSSPKYALLGEEGVETGSHYTALAGLEFTWP